MVMGSVAKDAAIDARTIARRIGLIEGPTTHWTLRINAVSARRSAIGLVSSFSIE
jgi:hypothetical protein